MDLISRQAAIDALTGIDGGVNMDIYTSEVKKILSDLPSVLPTIYGYNIEHLELIARYLQKADLPPESSDEVLKDIGRIVTVIVDEFEESLRKSMTGKEDRTI